MGSATEVSPGRRVRARTARHRSRYLVAVGSQPRVRRASDLTAVVAGAVLVG